MSHVNDEVGSHCVPQDSMFTHTHNTSTRSILTIRVFNARNNIFSIEKTMLVNHAHGSRAPRDVYSLGKIDRLQGLSEHNYLFHD
jgi:hypothetical protein